MEIDKREFYGKLKKLALPIAFQSLMLAAVAACDALMLGRVAQDQMTAVSLATQIQFVQNMFLMAATAAGSILGAQYWGKGDRETVRRRTGKRGISCTETGRGFDSRQRSRQGCGRRRTAGTTDIERPRLPFRHAQSSADGNRVGLSGKRDPGL